MQHATTLWKAIQWPNVSVSKWQTPANHAKNQDRLRQLAPDLVLSFSRLSFVSTPLRWRVCFVVPSFQLYLKDYGDGLNAPCNQQCVPTLTVPFQGVMIMSWSTGTQAQLNQRDPNECIRWPCYHLCCDWTCNVRKRPPIIWLAWDTIATPPPYISEYQSVACLIHSYELFMERPCHPHRRSTTYCQYKPHNAA